MRLQVTHWFGPTQRDEPKTIPSAKVNTTASVPMNGLPDFALGAVRLQFRSGACSLRRMDQVS